MKKNILVVGCGKTGASVCKFLKEFYHIYLYDDSQNSAINLANNLNISSNYIVKSLANLPQNLEFCVVSPGFRTTHNPHEIIVKLRELSIKIVSDYDIMCQNLSKMQKIIGITGTNGKSTTTSLIDFALNNLGARSIACGNIGKPVLSCDFSNINYITLECSSYQLEISNLNIYAGILLNITPDHLEHHGNIEEYSQQKAKIFQANSVSIISLDDENCANIFHKIPGAIGISCKKILQNGYSYYAGKFYKNGEILPLGGQIPQIIGVHNMQNILAALAFLITEGFDIHDIWGAICKFESLPHRMEKALILQGITFINDSKATNPDAARQAIASLSEIYLIAGGVSKYPNAIKDISDLYPRIMKFFLIGDAAK